VTLHFEDEGRSAPADVVTTFGVIEAPRALFNFSVRVEPDGRTADGVERHAVRVEVRNVGTGPSGERTYVSVKNLGPDGPFIAKSRHVVGALAPGMTANAVIPIELRRAPASPELPMQVRIVDEELEELVAERIVWAVRASNATATAWHFAAPRLALTPDPAQGPATVKGDTLHLRGTATLPRAAVAPAPRLRDVFVVVNERKVLYAEPEAGSDGSSVAFEADLPLEAGTNRISVFAREGDELRSRKSFVVQRRPPGQRWAP
jgi:hypothetical protein